MGESSMKIRKSNFELLRIISMFLIVLYHVIYHGHVIENSTGLFKTLIEFILFISLMHVNLFVLLTGYFQVGNKFSFKKIWSIINSCLFYKIIFLILFAGLGLITVNKTLIIREVSLLNIDDYWFVKNYLFLYCLSPFLNKLANSLSKKEYGYMLIALTLIFSLIPYLSGNRAFSNDGFTLYNFIYLYLIGAYLRLYSVKENYLFKNMTADLFILIMIILFILSNIFNYSIFLSTKLLMVDGTVAKEIFGGINVMSNLYSNPFIIFESVVFFLIFSVLDIQSKIINSVSKLTFGVYLIHDNIFLSKYLYKWLKIDNGPIESFSFIINIFVSTILIFLVCAIIEYIRQFIFKFIYNRKISVKMRNKYYKLISDLKFKEVN